MLQKYEEYPHQKRLGRKWVRLILLTLAVAFSLICLRELQPEKVNAVDLPKQAVEISNNWQYASFPVEDFRSYSSPFGYRTSPTNPSKKEFHKGLDIVAPVGSYIRNWWTGTVVDVSDNTACGTSLQILSGEWLHIYCHLSGSVQSNAQGRYLSDPGGNLQIWLGQEVSVGTRIARVGMTGRTTGPHLHWGLKYAGNYVDPALVLREMYKQQTALSRASNPNS